MKNNDFQHRLPQHKEPLEIAEHDSEYQAPVEPVVSKRSSPWVVWTSLGLIALAVMLCSIGIYGGLDRRNEVRLADIGASDGASRYAYVPVEEAYVAEEIVAAPDDYVSDADASNAVATDAAKADGTVSVVNGQVQNDAGSAVAAAEDDVVYMFPLNGTAITDNATLNQVAEEAKKSGDDVVIEAYADPSGSADYNLALSQKRADSVADYLVAHGVEESHINAVGKGVTDAYPTAAQDRRAVVHLIHG